MGLVGRLVAKYELYRLEQRYTRREKRTTFYSDAQYVNGEYIYTSSPVKVDSFPKRDFSVRVTSLSPSRMNSIVESDKERRESTILEGTVTGIRSSGLDRIMYGI